MIELLPQTAPGTGGGGWAFASRFPAGSPGPGRLLREIRRDGRRPTRRGPRGAGSVGHSYFAAPDRFLPVLGAAFERIILWERLT